jgi:hypothetical protein
LTGRAAAHRGDINIKDISAIKPGFAFARVGSLALQTSTETRPAIEPGIQSLILENECPLK